MPNPGYIVGGKYRLEREIGKGGFGVVYRAMTLEDDQMVAVKLVSRNDEGQVTAEQLGALIQQTFGRQHGMVPEVIDIGTDEHYLFIAMELVQAPTLAALLHRKPLEPRDAAAHAIGLCRFLEHAHTFEAVIGNEPFDRIVHGDLTASNVFVLPDGHIKVLDFGIAKALEKDRRVKTMGAMTPPYVSPQRLETGHGSEQDDCWALGVIVYEMIRGKRPHSAIEDPHHHYAALSRAIRSNAPREPLPESCPIEIAAIIDKILNVRESARYGNAEALRLDFEAFLDGRVPAAMEQFQTPATIVRPIDAAALPIPLATPAIPATLPRPTAPPSASGSGVADLDAQAPNAAVVHARRNVGIARRLAWVVALLMVISVFTSEAVAWIAAERFRAGVAALDLQNVASAREEYDRLRGASPLRVATRMRVDNALGRRLISLADGVLADFRREEPTVAEAQWRQAASALDWASHLVSDPSGLKAKSLICAGHLDRIAAQIRMHTNQAEARKLYARAVDEFRQAAALDTASPDPYLGLSRVYIYGLKDVDGGAKAIADAEARGHAPGWRDRAQLGDGYLRRANGTRLKSIALPEPENAEALKSAREDYLRCVAAFEPILDRGRSRQNRDYCQRRADAIPASNADSEGR
ncbi:MAG TPA: serine/threonine-protein kinase [Vicinamibacterales bacterium]